MKNLFLLTILMTLTVFCNGQASTLGNGGLPGDYLGWDNTVNSTLEIRHDTPGENIIFGTSNLERMRIKEKAITYEM